MTTSLNRVDYTPEAAALIPALLADHGPLMFHQSGEGEFQTSPRDVLLGHVEGCPVYIDKTQWETWSHTTLTLDVVLGRGSGFSLEAPRRVRLLTRSTLCLPSSESPE